MTDTPSYKLLATSKLNSLTRNQQLRLSSSTNIVSEGNEAQYALSLTGNLRAPAGLGRSHQVTKSPDRKFVSDKNVENVGGDGGL